MATPIEPLASSLVAIIEPDGFTLDWDETGLSEAPLFQRDLMAAFQAHPYRALLQLGFHLDRADLSDPLRFMADLAGAYITELARAENLESLRDRVQVALSDDTAQRILGSAPFLIGGAYLSRDWLGRMWDGLHQAFQEEIRAYHGTVEDFFARRHAAVRPLGRVYFHLVENKEGDTPFAFLATYAPDPGQGKRHVPLKNALREYEGDHRQMLDLLSTVTRAAETSAFVTGLLDSGEIFHPLRLTAGEAYTFLKEVPMYETAGILCRIPKWWRSPDNRLRVTVDIGSAAPSRVGSDAILDFDSGIALGGERLSPDEVRQLLSETDGLAYIKGKWVEVDHERLEKLLEAYEAAQKRGGSLSIVDALRFELFRGRGGEVDEAWDVVDISHGQWLNELLKSLREPTRRRPLDFAGELSATLRPYQERGVEWLAAMRRWGLGACLADDMGLGKTLQVLALLTALRQEGRLKAILVVPASLLGNWMEEMQKFTPALAARLAHPSAMSADKLANPHWLDSTEVVLTTYGLVQRYDWMRETSWDVVILDEAQAIKNPGTKQARAVKSLRANFRVALTGTPIENRLSDLWSLFDFLNRGLLGTAAEFTQFAKSLRQHPQGYAPLKQLANPFILRRVKTDKRVIDDLPDKIEVTTRAGLTRRQIALYSQVVADVSKKIAELSGMERRGLILASLMKLKQICNHPDQYLGQDGFDSQESGKFIRLGELAETIYEKRERVLVFTQFREMTEPLARYLESVFHHHGLILHGGTPVGRRREIVAAFQGSPYVPFLVLSLKAGGVGLNLTAANHVIHFDRWWNPAVENQATDRAFRIGQTKKVLVHKFMTQGTIEEKIDQLIQDKVKMSEEIIPTMQETWIGDLEDRTLMDLFRLDVRGAQ